MWPANMVSGIEKAAFLRERASAKRKLDCLPQLTSWAPLFEAVTVPCWAQHNKAYTTDLDGGVTRFWESMRDRKYWHDYFCKMELTLYVYLKNKADNYSHLYFICGLIWSTVWVQSLCLRVICYLLSVNYCEGSVNSPEHINVDTGALLFPSFLAYYDMCSSLCPQLTSFEYIFIWFKLNYYSWNRPMS